MPKGVYKHKPCSIETKKKISIANKGRVVSEDFKRKLSEALKGNKNCLNRYVSKETREKISKALKGNTNWLGKHHSESSKKKISEKLKGRLVSEETRIKLSESHKGQVAWNKGKKIGPSWNKGKRCPQISKALRGKPSGMLGKHHSEETKSKISRSNKGHPVSKEVREKLRKIGLNMSVETKKKISEKLKGRKKSEEFKRKCSLRTLSEKTRGKISNALKGKMPKNLNYPLNNKVRPFGNIKRGYYNINGKRMFFRSSWEATYALYLDFLIKQKQIQKWEYEVDTFIFEKIKFGTRSYKPDFKIYNNDGTIEYHEVKGWVTAQTMTQLKRFKKYYPDEFSRLRFIIPDKYSRSVVNGETIAFLIDKLGVKFEDIISYNEIEKKFSHLIPKWEY